MTIKRRKVLVGAALGFAAGALPPLAAHAGTIEETKKRGTFRVGVTQAPPWFSKDPKTGQWSSGLGISMGKAMAEALGRTTPDYIVDSYRSLFLQRRESFGLAGPDMLFDSCAP